MARYAHLLFHSDDLTGFVSLAMGAQAVRSTRHLNHGFEIMLDEILKEQQSRRKDFVGVVDRIVICGLILVHVCSVQNACPTRLEILG